MTSAAAKKEKLHELCSFIRTYTRFRLLCITIPPFIKIVYFLGRLKNLATARIILKERGYGLWPHDFLERLGRFIILISFSLGHDWKYEQYEDSYIQNEINLFNF